MCVVGDRCAGTFVRLRGCIPEFYFTLGRSPAELFVKVCPFEIDAFERLFDCGDASLDFVSFWADLKMATDKCKSAKVKV